MECNFIAENLGRNSIAAISSHNEEDEPAPCGHVARDLCVRQTVYEGVARISLAHLRG